jgi:hypothetical protein
LASGAFGNRLALEGYVMKKISKEEWIELSKKLRNRVSGYFTAEKLDVIDEFIRLAGTAASFDQVG